MSIHREMVATCERAQLARDVAVTHVARDVMLTRPKTLDAEASVADVRESFADPKVVSILLVDEGTFVGVLDRRDIPSGTSGSAPARRHARRNESTVTPDTPMEDALDLLDRNGWDRLVVLEDDGVTLAGLLCLDRQRAGFCSG